ncbi:MAG TPA: formate dehydrogenase accessory sulfurtransferase FdhD [Bryobacteraceae bacterium]|nr:formate dehydrogenase accessory sulfurtransferase FdhD [Bryobacteraceae bacterium]
MSTSSVERLVDEVTAEEPLEIRIAYRFKEARIAESFAVTMRTPGHDRELAAGLLCSEGVIRALADVVDLRMLGSSAGVASNEILAELAPDADVDMPALGRRGYVNSSCGVCGKRTREAISKNLPQLADSAFDVNWPGIAHLPERLREQQRDFYRTGGLHAAALADRYGNIEAVFEDIGRHNALDKLIGHCLLEGRLPLSDRLIFMSSRSSFELVQKALMAGCPMLATVGGPSSLAIEMAREHGLTLLGFFRDGHCNVYSGEWRLHSEVYEAAPSKE